MNQIPRQEFRNLQRARPRRGPARGPEHEGLTPEKDGEPGRINCCPEPPWMNPPNGRTTNPSKMPDSGLLVSIANLAEQLNVQEAVTSNY
jgi:hypothetical protein